MKISVIVTTYNRPDALERVLKGLVNQTRLPEEIMIADDGSDAETREMLSPYLKNTRIRIKHIWQEDKGFRAAMIRNKAIMAASGEYIILLDGDCIPAGHFVADHETLAQKGRFFQGKRVLVNENIAEIFTEKEAASFFNLLWLAFKKDLSNRHHIFRIPYLPAVSVSKLSGVRSCNMGIFRSDIMAVNGFNHAFTGWGREDTEFVVRLMKYGLKRKEHPFMAICFHLWHREASRDCLGRNDDELARTMASDAWQCREGIGQLR